MGINFHLNKLDALQQGASQFEQQAGKLKRKFWWKNLKVKLFSSINPGFNTLITILTNLNF